MRNLLGDHLRTSDEKTYFDAKHFPGKPLPLSFFAFRSEWGKVIEGGRIYGRGRSTLAIAEANIRVNPHLGRTANS